MKAERHSIKDPEDVAKIRRVAMKTAGKMGFREHREDLAHDVILKWLASGFSGQTVSQAIIDAIRHEAGRPGTSRGDAAHRLIDESTDGVSAPSTLVVFDQLLSLLESTERAIVCLSFLWGLSSIEIAHVFGLTESRVSQRLKSALIKLNVEIGKGT